MNFRARLLYLCLLLTAFTCVVALMDRNSMRKIVDISTPLGKVVTPKIIHLAKIQEQFRELRIEVRSLAVEGLSSAEIDAIEGRAKTAITAVNTAIAAYQKLSLDDQEKTHIAELKSRYEKFLLEGQSLFDRARSKKPEEQVFLRTFFLDRCPALASAVYEIATEMTRYEENVAHKTIEEPTR